MHAGDAITVKFHCNINLNDEIRNSQAILENFKVMNKVVAPYLKMH